jgi:hypothetical protein
MDVAKIKYEIAPIPAQAETPEWSIRREGEPGTRYVSQEAAFEVAVSQAQGDLRSGNDIVIEVRSSVAGAVDRAAR